MTKNRCESLAQSIASIFFKLGCTNNDIGTVLRNQLNTEKIAEVLEQLKNCPVGLDDILKNIVSFGVAYHHAGLTFDERDIIEGAFKCGAIRVLVATSTLSSGVNLPARRVIIRTPVFQRQPLNILTYKQMIGRAGRMGRDIKGESILICTEAERKIGQELMVGVLNPVKSCIESEDRYMRAVLEIIASQVTCTESELNLYTKCSLLFNQEKKRQSQMLLLGETLDQLKNYELVRVQEDGNEIQYVATSLGKACLSSSMAPNDGLSLFCELQKARQCIVLENDLHLIYLVTPYSVSSQWNDIDWLHLLTLWESLTRAMKKVGELIGIQESFIIQRLRGSNHAKIDQKKLNIHKRFYTALALQDLVNEVPLSQVAEKFQCPRGFLQGLQQAAATFAGMVTAFCHQLGWKNMELLISQFQDRLHFGIHSELIELMKLSSLNGIRARALFDKGFETISSIASADVNTIENILLKAVPFQSEKERDGDDQCDLKKRNKIKNIWITGCCGMTAKEAALNLILEARKYLQEEIGVKEIKWNELENKTNYSDSNSNCNNFLNSQQNSKQTNGTNGHIIAENVSSPQAKNGIITDYENNKDKNLKNNISLLSNKGVLINDNVERTANTKHSTLENKSLRKEKIDQDCIEIKDSPIMNNIKFARNDSPSILKDDIVWESLDFSTALNNVSKLKASDKIMSPEISFGDSELNIAIPENANENKLLKDMSAKDASTKDVSLFSSDESGSSFFDETLPIDLLPTTFSNSEDNKNTSLNDVTIDCQSILNAFTSSIAVADDDDDIKLMYEEDRKELKPGNLNISQAVEIINSQDAVKIWDYKSPLKRQSHRLNELQQISKRLKKDTDDINFNIITLKCNRSKKLSVEIRQKVINCYILREIDLIEYLDKIKSYHNASIYLDLNESTSTIEIIGSSIFKKFDESHKGNIITNINALKGIAMCFNKDLCVYFDFTSVTERFYEIKKKISYWLSIDSLNLSLLSLKTTYVHLKRSLAVDLNTNCTDLSLAEWLIQSDEKIPDINDLMRKYCDIDLSTEMLNIGNAQKNLKSADCIESALFKAWCIQCISEKQKELLLKQYQDINNIANVETYVARILANCEHHGLAVDRDLAAKLLIDVKNTQEILMKKAYKICGYHFNFNSSKDVAKVLGFYKGRRVSTKKSVLTAHNSPLASIVIYWRKLNAILTKTLYPLTEKASNYSTADRINPSYTMHTCTGRITMREPNLQNVPRTFSIPVKYLTMTNENDLSTDVIEFNCRNVFVATPGCVFVSADYCQLEMRILTHYSCDPVLTKIMRSDVDVFKAIAASWSCLPEEEVDDDLRQKAKQLCYGILYGMGNRTLSQHLDVTEMEAAVFMDSFYNTYPSLKMFKQSIIDACREHGFVETLKKRRRYLPDIKSNLPHKRSAAERQAVNTTIQGSAADVAKAAMCAIDKTQFSHIKPRLILQLHDELIYEVQEKYMKDFSKVLKRVMEDTVCLNVPLPVKVKSGKTWGTLNEIKV
ncbi:DNA polymerase theta [Papilio xuthus]|uniref:DNA polymerase theta n=1 Tax=Papilio xuthus TaxID=66420 RepID=A0A194QBH4_PAPXU|nr:DNA polymerase theta [Papilio xuthus]